MEDGVPIEMGGKGRQETKGHTQHGSDKTHWRGASRFCRNRTPTTNSGVHVLPSLRQLRLPPRIPVLQFRGDRCCPKDSPYSRLVTKGEQDGPSGALARPPPGPRLLEQAGPGPGSQRRAIRRW
ncbi:hypothetical protein NDU88_005790 [Pleurodeles waltl]|uniref:Uncharacterized protein n=1 Tax=Pleurodeles waltl TaxID=8319 RepID=A0AAV7TCY9_PLEWA|nr:hypothetical protein NDU88_005790 [Pleurodeles waltl]